MTRFLTIEQSIRENGYRHESKGLWWIELGFDDRARGSFRKALRNYKKADEMLLYRCWNSMLNVLADRIANAIMNGTS